MRESQLNVLLWDAGLGPKQDDMGNHCGPFLAILQHVLGVLRDLV